MVVFLNPKAGAGSALRKWELVAPSLPSSPSPLRVFMLNGRSSLDEGVTQFLHMGETDFVAAGGDGTINTLLNSLLSPGTGSQGKICRLGAIGLGSSNDFHKPFIPEQFVDEVCCKIDFKHARPRDVGCVSIEENGTTMKKYFLINASVGITAEANRFFNNPDRILAHLKRVHTGSAILYAAFSTISSFKNVQTRLQDSSTGAFTTNLTNLGVVKNSHFSGNLSYDSPISYDDGNLQIHLCHDMKRWDVVRLFNALSHGKFRTIQNTRSWSSPSLTVSADHPFAVEFDGEIAVTKRATFSVLQKFLKVCP